MSDHRSFYAHSHPSQAEPGDKWQLLAAHLRGVAQLAQSLAQVAQPIDEAIDSDEVRAKKLSFHEASCWAGLLHDLGKYRPEFQAYLRGEHPKTDATWHKQAGAAKAADQHRVDIAFAVAGHHGGLPDRADLREIISGPGGRDVVEQVWSWAVQENATFAKGIPTCPGGSDGLKLDVLVRLLFSCLVDADWTDTSRFEHKAETLTTEKPAPPLNPGDALKRVRTYIAEQAATCTDATVHSARSDVLNAALRAADMAPGLFGMTVPTGGGKTLSALAFALAHAKCHRLRRIIYAAPYLSIIEQNAREIRRALNAAENGDFVFEHHSLAEPQGDQLNDTRADERIRRAEAWDAPVIVTTNVQFYESLFSNRPGQCRKLHNIARSVVILDECQTLPPGLIAPTCSVLQQFAETAGCSIVLCTATQPAWSQRKELPEGLTAVREIVSPSFNLFRRLQRVHVQWPREPDERLTWSDVAARMADSRAALCVVNTKHAASCLFQELRKAGCGGALHLSTNMCPQHRLAVIDRVRGRLEAGDPCRLVSTQLIEAGVDVDFPFVLREMAPLEAIIQAAGRCNREGLLRTPNGTPGGRVTVFRSAEGSIPPDRWYKAGIAKVEHDFLGMGHEPDVGRPEDMEEYFRRLYHTGELDEFDIQDDRAALRFRTVAKKYRLIDDVTVPVVIATWDQYLDEIDTLLEGCRHAPSRRLFRQLARFQVNFRAHEIKRAGERVTLDGVCGLHVYYGHYDNDLGAVTDGSATLPIV